MSKHTPGPWRARKPVGGWHWQVQPADDSLAPVICDEIRGLDGADEANAILIAAAPKMLEALKLANRAMNHMGDVMNGMDIVLDEDIEIHDALAPDFTKEELTAGGPGQALQDLVAQARTFDPDLTSEEADHIRATMRDYLWPEGRED